MIVETHCRASLFFLTTTVRKRVTLIAKRFRHEFLTVVVYYFPACFSASNCSRDLLCVTIYTPENTNTAASAC